MILKCGERPLTPYPIPLDPFTAPCPFHRKLAMRGHAILQIVIDEALVWDTLFFGHVLEIVYDVWSNSQCNLPLETFGVRIRARFQFAQIVFLFHLITVVELRLILGCFTGCDHDCQSNIDVAIPTRLRAPPLTLFLVSVILNSSDQNCRESGAGVRGPFRIACVRPAWA